MKLVAVLVAHYPRQELSDASLEAFAKAIADLEQADMTRAMMAVVQKSEFFPTVAQLRETYALLRLGAPDPLHAWAQAIGAPPRHELVQRARRLIGDDWTWRNEPEWSHRKPFLAAYGEVLAKAIRRIAQPDLADAEDRALEPAPRRAELPPAEARGDLVQMSDEVRRQIEAAIGQPLRDDSQR